MNRLRMFAVVLSVVSLLVAIILLTVPGLGVATVIAVGIGAVILAAIAPFEARDAPARQRVVIACVAYSVALLVAVIAATLSPAGWAPPVMLGLLCLGGVAMSFHAYRTRNRRRRTGWNNYFDN